MTSTVNDIHCGYKYRIYPSDEQKELINKHFGGARWMYNSLLRLTNEAYERTQPTLKRCVLDENGKPVIENGRRVYETYENENYDPEAKRIESGDRSRLIKVLMDSTFDENGHNWPHDLDANMMSHERMHLDRAFQNFFKGIGGKPTPKTKHTPVQSYTTSIGKHRVAKTLERAEKNIVQLPRIGNMEMVYHRPMDGRPTSMTVTRNAKGEFYVSFSCEGCTRERTSFGDSVRAISLKMNGEHTASDGTLYGHESEYKSIMQRIARLQKKLARQIGSQKGEAKSANWIKTNDKINALYAKLANKRKDNMHRLSREIAESADIIILPDLKTKDKMAKRKGAPKRKHEKTQSKYHSRKAQRAINRKISDVSLCELKSQIAYKCEWRGGHCLLVPAKTEVHEVCPHCGAHHVSDVGHLSAPWTCPECGAKNIRENDGADALLEIGLSILEEEAKALVKPAKKTKSTAKKTVKKTAKKAA